MADYGLLTTGFVPKTMAVILEELQAAFRTAFGISLNVTTGIISRFIGIFAERETSLWELAEAIYHSQDPDAALDAALDAICALSGIFREPARKSTVTLTLCGTPATDVPEGSRAKVSSTGILFETTEDGVIVALDPWAALAIYALGDRVTLGGFCYEAIVAGTAGGTGPVGIEPGTETDGGVTWTWIGSGTGAVDATAASVDTGPFVAVSADISVIDTAVGGWDSVLNLLDATVGANQESNAELRARRDTELAAAGTSPIPAIRSALLRIEGVTAATVFYNPNDLTDVDGIPPHAVEALVSTVWDPGDDRDQLVYDCLFNNVAGGIKTHGDEVGTVTDSEGTDHTLKFTRPEEIDIWIILNVEKHDLEFPADGSAQIAAAISAWGGGQKTGRNAVASAITAQAFTVAGINDISSTLIGLSDPPTLSTTIAISLRQLAMYDTSRITVNLTSGTP